MIHDYTEHYRFLSGFLRHRHFRRILAAYGMPTAVGKEHEDGSRAFVWTFYKEYDGVMPDRRRAFKMEVDPEGGAYHFDQKGFARSRGDSGAFQPCSKAVYAGFRQWHNQIVYVRSIGYTKLRPYQSMLDFLKTQ